MKKRVLSILSAAILAVTASIPVNVSALKQEEIATGRLDNYIESLGENTLTISKQTDSANNTNAIVITDDYKAYNLNEMPSYTIVTFDENSEIPVEEINAKISPNKLTETEETNKYTTTSITNVYNVLKEYDCVKSIEKKYIVTICRDDLWASNGIYINSYSPDFSIEKIVEEFSELGLVYQPEKNQGLKYFFAFSTPLAYSTCSEDFYAGFDKLIDSHYDYTVGAYSAELVQETVSIGYENIYTKGKSDNISITELYDFEEFIQMNKNEICNLSNEVANEYSNAYELMKTLEKRSQGIKSITVICNFNDISPEYVFTDTSGNSTLDKYKFQKMLNITESYCEIRDTFLNISETIGGVNLSLSYNYEKIDVETAAKMYLYITLNSNLNATCSIDFPLYVENNSIKGDANGDGYVNISDAVLVKGYLLNCEKYSISSERISCADVSGDNDGINIIDALKIQQYVVGLIDTF